MLELIWEISLWAGEILRVPLCSTQQHISWTGFEKSTFGQTVAMVFGMAYVVSLGIIVASHIKESSPILAACEVDTRSILSPH